MSWAVWIPLALVVILCVVGIVVSATRQVRMSNRLRQIGSSEEIRPDHELPLWMSLLAMFSSRLMRPKDRAALQDRLAGAGLYEDWHVDVWLVVRTVLVLGGLILGWIIFDVRPREVFSNPLPAFKYLILIFVCGRLPDWWLRDRTSRNREKIIASVPQAVDFMTICVESGLSLEDAFDRVGREMRDSAPEVATEMRITRSEMLMLDRTRALQRMKKRSGVREIENLADALIQSIRFGTPLVDTLQSIASESRARQVSNLEERAGAISAKVGVPLILLVLFPLVVLLAGPPLVAFFRSM